MTQPLDTPERFGVLAAGNVIVDHVKMIEHWPEQDHLTSIFEEMKGNGGGPYNVLKDLRRIGVSYPLEIAGRIGVDSDGEWILEDLKQCGVKVEGLVRDPETPTSYTDVMTVCDTGRRTFFHQRGANAKFEEADIIPTLERSSARWFYLGYLMLLDQMDTVVEGQTMASRVLKKAGELGFKRIVDCVSSPRKEFSEVVASAASETDVILLNELEAQLAIGGKKLPPLEHPEFARALEEFSQKILHLGVKEEVVIHSSQGAVVASRKEGVKRMGSLCLPPDWIKGASGAGDAFAAGYLHGLHENWDIESRLALAMGSAASCMTHPSTSEGVFTLAKCQALKEEFGLRDF